jgi:hypothetical protein
MAPGFSLVRAEAPGSRLVYHRARADGTTVILLHSTPQPGQE